MYEGVGLDEVEAPSPDQQEASSAVSGGSTDAAAHGTSLAPSAGTDFVSTAAEESARANEDDDGPQQASPESDVTPPEVPQPAQGEVPPPEEQSAPRTDTSQPRNPSSPKQEQSAPEQTAPPSQEGAAQSTEASQSPDQAEPPKDGTAPPPSTQPVKSPEAPRATKGNTSPGAPRSTKADTPPATPRSTKADSAPGSPKTTKGDTSPGAPRATQADQGGGSPRQTKNQRATKRFGDKPRTSVFSLGYETTAKFVEVPLTERLNKQSVPYKGDPIVRCSPMLQDDKLLECFEAETRTLHDVFMRGLTKSNGGPCVGRRPGPGKPWQWLTYQEVVDRVQRFGSGLVKLGARPEPSQFIGIFAQNRIEWKVTEQMCNSYSMVLVTLYDTLGQEAVEHIVTQCELKYIVVDTSAKALKLLCQVEKGKFFCKLLVVMDDLSAEVKKQASNSKTKVMSFTEVEEIGKEKLLDFKPPKPEDLHTICYTSGTTGLPKGVQITHGNILANMAGVYAMGSTTFLNLTEKDVSISYLPLAHVLERVVSAQVYFVGGSIGFFQGDIKLLMDDIATLRPTVFPVVPRLLNRIYDKVWSKASQSKIKKALLKKGLKAKSDKLNRGIVTKSTIWDKLVFRKIQRSVGGRVKYCLTGAAPVSVDVINFMRCALGVVFTEGYGQTEATAAITLSLPGDYNSGGVGGPTLCNLIKLVDVPEKSYFAKDGKGEICVKGTNITSGYYKSQDKTKEAIDEQGWLHTGDVGMWLDSGALKIIDRQKHIFKLAQGEYIAPEKIEQVLVQSTAIAQVFVHGDSLQEYLVAIVIPDSETLVNWCSYRGVQGKYEELCAKEEVKKLIQEDIVAYGKLRGLHAFEIPKRIHLSTEMFTVDNDMLTPTFKTKRPQIKARYQPEIDAMYKQ